MKQKLLTNGKGILLVLLCMLSAFSVQAVSVIPYLNALQSFGGSTADLGTFTPIEGDYTLEVQGTVGVQISVGGLYTYTPTVSGTVRFVQKINKIYVYEGSTFMTTITPTYTITYPTITDGDAATNVNNLLRNASFETTGTLVGGTNYNFGTPWVSNVTVAASGGIRITTGTGLVNGSYLCLWRGTANSNYFAQPILSTIKPNTSYKVIVRETAGSNAYANFNFGLGSTVSGMEYDFKPISLGNTKTGTWSITLHTTQNVTGTTYFTVKNTPNNTANTGSDPVAQMDYLALVEGTLSVPAPGITGVSSATYLSGTAYAPEGVAINYAGGDYYDMTPSVINPVSNPIYADGPILVVG